MPAAAEKTQAFLITEGNLSRSVWALTWPTVLTMLLQTANWTMDIFFIKPLGTDAQAAVGASGQLLFLLFAAIIGITTGTTTLVAQFMGARNLHDASDAAKQSILWGTAGSVVLSLFLYLTLEPALWLLGLTAGVREMARQYMFYIILFMPFGALLFIYTAIFRGLGDVWSPLKVTAFTNVLNIVLDYVFIFGMGPIPRMGVAGAALAASVSRIFGVILCYPYIARVELWRYTGTAWRPQWDWFRRILNIGTPAAVQQVVRNLGGIFFIRILAQTPQHNVALATYSIGMRIESWAFMPAFAFSIASATIVGQNLGAAQPQRAEQAGWMSAKQCATLLGALAVVLFAIPAQLMGIFAKEAAVVSLGIGYLRWNAIGEPAIGVGMVLDGALRGAGDTRFAMWASIVSTWLVRVGMGYLFCSLLGGGAPAAWPIMCLSMFVYTAMLVARFKSGKWKMIKV